MAANVVNPSSFSERVQRSSSKRVTLYNDGVLLLSFAYSTADILSQWEDFEVCHKNVGLWLVGSYLLMAIFRVCNYVGQICSAEGERILHVRQQRPVLQILSAFTWLVLLPSFSVWTGLGSYWLALVLWHTPDCLPAGAHPWFVIFCQVLCYFWISMYALYLRNSLKFELRLRRAEANLRSVQTEDTLQRWGRMSFMGEAPGDANGIVSTEKSQGLPGDVIRALPRVKMDKTRGKECRFGEQCAICIADFNDGDWARCLPKCNHWFHQECIDLWLVRNACCPLCKACVGEDAKQTV